MSWQPYTMIRAGEQVLMGQYPTGGVFAWRNHSLTFPKNNVGVEPGAGTEAREAMTLAIYGDDVLLGMWPWGSLFGRDARDQLGIWSFRKRVFTAPAVTKEEAPWMTFIEKNHPENASWHPNGASPACCACDLARVSEELVTLLLTCVCLRCQVLASA